MPLLTDIVGETRRTETTVSVLNLVPGSLYDIRVFAVSTPGFQTPSAVLHVRTAHCAKSGPQPDGSDGYPTIRVYPAKPSTTVSALTAPAMAREPSGGHPMGRRGTTGKRPSTANPVSESQPVAPCDDAQRSTDEEVAGTLAQLSDRFQKVQQDNEVVESQILDEEEEFETALSVNPRLARAHYLLANQLLAQGDAAAAEEHYQTVLAIKPDYADHWGFFDPSDLPKCSLRLRRTIPLNKK